MDSITDADTGKRKRYASSDEPMSLFPAVQQLFLNETLWHEGLGYSHSSQVCALCKRPLGADAPAGQRLFRCEDCGIFAQCEQCCMSRHALGPLHVLQEWTGVCWRRVTLKSLELVYQIGHGGLPCLRPEALIRSLMVIDTNGVHEIHYRYCGCNRSDTANNLVQLMWNAWYPASMIDPDTCATFAVLDVFRLLNVVGNVNARDFITSLERRTDGMAATGLKWLPWLKFFKDRYKAFLRMSRQYAFLQRLRRAGRGHDAAGIAATKPGELMVVCWACPYDGRNLPANWRDVDPKYRYLFRLILAMDANFKLKNKICARERDDPSLGPGWGAFVEPKNYKKHLRKYVGEKDISTCIAFAALTQKDTRNTAGLHISGVGGCMCARHECMRPNRLGDFQKGERYANMDYVLLSALAGFNLMELTISYDIACQWKKNFGEHIAKLPLELQMEFDDILLECGLPVWHALAHEDYCATLNSLNYITGVGHSDGEGVERLWAFLNSCSYQSKEMGLGNRADTIKDKLDCHNFQKNLGQADSLRRKLIVAVAERARQVEVFKEINKSISAEVRGDWQMQLDAFAADHSAPNPYNLTHKGGPTEAGIRLSLKLEEQEAIRKGAAALHATSTTAFLSAGLQLEETQRQIKAELAGVHLTADHQSKVQEHRMAFMAKLRNFRDLQSMYTPGALRAMAAEEAGRDSELPPPTPENIKLCLPSALPEAERTGPGCQHNIINMEATLREGQCSNSLITIRSRLHSKRYLITFRNDNITGQKKSTRSHSMIDQLGDRVEVAARKYRDARTALTALKGADYAPHLQVLKASDIVLEGEDARDAGAAAKSDRVAMRKLGRIGAGKSGQYLRSNASSSKSAGLSWIWMAQGSLDNAEKDLHESLRVEWSKAKARKNRWDEEVELLREEMRRVIRYLDWQTALWETRAVESEARVGLAGAVRAGIKAYASKQATFHRELCEFFREKLSESVDTAALAVIATSVDDDARDTNLHVLFTHGMFCLHIMSFTNCQHRVTFYIRERAGLHYYYSSAT
ncbi:hypothetical protein C8R44DRAFT_628252 [Mycena epipterygia]|nr:hypothetical protein C8R44DRAFT_628252 [Mycena epipterygia]